MPSAALLAVSVNSVASRRGAVAIGDDAGSRSSSAGQELEQAMEILDDDASYAYQISLGEAPEMKRLQSYKQGATVPLPVSWTVSDPIQPDLLVVSPGDRRS